MWKYRCAASVWPVFLVPELVLVWMPATPFLRVCWPLSQSLCWMWGFLSALWLWSPCQGRGLLPSCWSRSPDGQAPSGLIALEYMLCPKGEGKGPHLVDLLLLTAPPPRAQVLTQCLFSVRLQWLWGALGRIAPFLWGLLGYDMLLDLSVHRHDPGKAEPRFRPQTEAVCEACCCLHRDSDPAPAKPFHTLLLGQAHVKEQNTDDLVGVPVRPPHTA